MPLWVMLNSVAAKRGLRVTRPTAFVMNLAGRKLDQVVVNRRVHSSSEASFHGLKVPSWTAQGGRDDGVSSSEIGSILGLSARGNGARRPYLCATCSTRLAVKDVPLKCPKPENDGGGFAAWPIIAPGQRNVQCSLTR